MKKLLLIALIYCFACCGDNEPVLPEPEPEPAQDYTSYIIENKTDITFIDCRTGFFDTNKKCLLLDSIGNILSEKKSPEIIVSNDTLTHLYLWFDIPTTGIPQPMMCDSVFILERNKKNIVSIPLTIKGHRVFKTDIINYPH